MSASEAPRLRVAVSIGADGGLRSVVATGHAGAQAAGSNVACAAATLLLRTAYEVAAAGDGVRASADAPVPGVMRFELAHPGCAVGRLATVADFLVAGLRTLQHEYPGSVDLCIDYERRT